MNISEIAKTVCMIKSLLNDQMYNKCNWLSSQHILYSSFAGYKVKKPKAS